MIKIYSKTGCPYCDMAKQWFNDNGIPFVEIKIDDNEERHRFYEKVGDGVKTMPQIFIDGEHVGGYSELMEKQKDIIGRVAVEFINDNDLSF